MSHRLGETVEHGWLRAQAHRTNLGSGDIVSPRSRSRAADKVLHSVCWVAARLAIDPVEDRGSLFQQYDFKLSSQGDRLGLFCMSVAPALVGMGLVLVAFKVLSRFRSAD
jgi:hypothetical protein